MEKKNYQLVAWTRMSSDGNDLEVRMTPWFRHEMEGPFYEEITRYRQELNTNPEARARLVHTYRRNADFLFLTGQYGDGIRMLGLAALYCNAECASRAMQENFLNLYRMFVDSVRLYGRYDILLEESSKRIEKTFRRITDGKVLADK